MAVGAWGRLQPHTRARQRLALHLLLLDALLDFALVLVAVLLRDSAALLAFAFLGSFLVKHVGVSNELALPHDALLRGPEVSSLLAIHVSTEATAAAVNELRSDDFDAEAVGDDLKENKIVKWALKNFLIYQSSKLSLIYLFESTNFRHILQLLWFLLQKTKP